MTPAPQLTPPVNPELSSPEGAWCERSEQPARGGQCPLHGGDACLITLTGLWRKAFPASSGESPGGAAPPEPLDFQKAREAVKRIMWGQPTEPTLSDEDFIFATLDQAESEIARLRALLNPPLSSGTYPYRDQDQHDHP